jgi:predicted  nucleic acid-binding Zn-ribbon protein
MDMARDSERIAILERAVLNLDESVKALCGYIATLRDAHNDAVKSTEKNWQQVNANFSEIVSEMNQVIVAVNRLTEEANEGEEWKRGSAD